MERLIYLDHAATTPMRPEAIAAMLPFLDGRFGNTGGNYRLGRDARRAVDDARDRVAAVLGCAPGEVIFTSGGTESDNMAIAGAVAPADARRAAPSALCSAVEHHAVLDAVHRRRGATIGVDRTGRLDLDHLAELATAADAELAVVSVMAVNNEIGTVNDLAAIRGRLAAVGCSALLHSDAVQAAGWLDLAELWSHVDALSLSAHKFGGPKGVGVLALRATTNVAPLLVGGGQERGRRSGTHNVAGIVASSVALELAAANRATAVEHVADLRDRLVAELLAADLGISETVPSAHKVAGNAHVLVDDVETETLLVLLDDAGLCASAAAACASGALESSHVLAAIGLTPAQAGGAVRLTLGHATTSTDIDAAIETITAAVRTLRQRRLRRRTGIADPAVTLPELAPATIGGRR